MGLWGYLKRLLWGSPVECVVRKVIGGDRIHVSLPYVSGASNDVIRVRILGSVAPPLGSESETKLFKLLCDLVLHSPVWLRRLKPDTECAGQWTAVVTVNNNNPLLPTIDINKYMKSYGLYSASSSEPLISPATVPPVYIK